MNNFLLLCITFIYISNSIQNVSSYESQEAMCYDLQGLNCDDIHAENTLGFYRMFQTLESQYFETKHNMKLTPCYQLLLKQIIKYKSDPKENEVSAQYKKVLNFLYTATLGRICSLNEITKSQMPKNPFFLDDTQSDPIFVVNKLKLEGKAGVQKKYKNKYRQNLKSTVRQLRGFTTKHLTKELHQIKNKLDKQLNKLLKTFLESERENTENLKGILDGLATFNGLKEINHFINMTTAVTFDIIEYFSNEESTKILNNQTQASKKHISPYFKELLGNSTAHARQTKETVLRQFITDWRKTIKQHSELNFTAIVLSTSTATLDSLSYTDDDMKKIIETQKILKDTLQSLHEQLLMSGASQEAVEASKSLKTKFNIAITVPELYIKYINDSKIIDLISNTQLLGDQRDHENFCNHNLETIILISRNLKTLLDNIENSLIAFPESMCEIRKGFQILRIHLQEVNKSILISSVEMLQESIVTLINIYDQIKNLNYLSEFSQNLQHAFAEESQNIKIEDEKLKLVLNNLDLIMLSDILSIQYERAVFLLKQWVFPYAKYNIGGSFYNNEGSPSYLAFTNSDRLIEETKNRIVHINSTLNNFYQGYGVGNLDAYIMLGEFASGYVSVKPFSKWKNNKNQKAIAQLLSGKEVVLKADDPFHYNALKFKYVQLFIKTENKTLQKEVDELLKEVRIKMTHFGNSYYRCNDKNYVIANRVSSQKTAFVKPNPKDYGRYNFFLSPNAMWLLKLSSHEKFANLRKYRDSVFLTLEGSGIYLSNYDCNALDLKIYYEEWNLLPEK